MLICIVVVECKNDRRRRVIPWNNYRWSRDREASCAAEPRPEYCSQARALQAQSPIFRSPGARIPYNLNVRDCDRVTVGVRNSHAHRIAGITDRLGSDVAAACD